jgi:outer membrane protein OmpA-like peptidoglycan-associated protein
MALLDSSIDDWNGKSPRGAKAPPAVLAAPVARPSSATLKPIGVFEAGGGVLAFVAFVSFVTTTFDGDMRAPAPGVKVAALAKPPAARKAVARPAAAAPAPKAAATAPAISAPKVDVAASETPRPFVEAPVVEAPAPAKPAAPLEAAATRAPPAMEIAPPAIPSVAAALPGAGLSPPTLEFSTIGGKVHVYGAVADKETAAALLDDLKAAYGAGAVTGAIAIDPRRAPAAWLAKMPAALKSLKTPGLIVLFSGGDLVLRGHIGDAERLRLSSSLAGLFGGDVKVVALADHLQDLSTRANAHVAASLATLQPGFSAAGLVGVLNLSIVNFALSSAEVPETDRAMLGEAAARFKQLAPGTSIEIAGHTDASGAEEDNVPLSRRRAEAVRAALVKAGVSGAMLVAKGHGGAVPVADNDSVEGRFRNRRIEYRVARP